MKLLKKLLPAITIASTAVIVTPMVTSCGGTSVSDINYSPSIVPYIGDPFESVKDVQVMYFNAVKSNAQIMTQDYCWTVAQQWNSWLNNESSAEKNKSINFSVSVKNLTFDVKSIDSVDYYLISGSISENHTQKYTMKYEVDSTECTFDYTINSSSNITFKNCYFYLAHTSDIWYIYISANNKIDWEVQSNESYSRQVKVTPTNGQSKTYSSNSNGNAIYNKYSGFPGNISFKSHYLANVKTK